jgi:hypothetical protein
MDAVRAEAPEVPSTLMMNIRGDEAKEGPIYNYARVFTWWAFTDMVLRAFKATLNNMNPEDVRSQPEPAAGEAGPQPASGTIGPGTAAPQPVDGLADQRTQQLPLDPDDMPIRNSKGTSLYCGLQYSPGHNILAYANFSDMPSSLYLRILIASTLAIIMQTGTTGSAVFIAYFTPTVGLGCRSLFYSVYGVVGLTVFVLLLLSVILSHQAMKMYQAAYGEDERTDFSKDPCPDVSSMRDSRSKFIKLASWWCRLRLRWILCASANLTRLLGKTLAILNAIFLVCLVLVEFLGLMDSCFCKSCHFQYGDRGWVVLFRTDEDYRNVGKLYWLTGLLMATTVCTIMSSIFFLGRTNLENIREVDNSDAT